MKNSRFIFVYTMGLLLTIFCFNGLNAQTYATPELKERVEREIAEKNKLLGIEEDEVKENLETPITLASESLMVRLLQPEVYRLVSVDAVNLKGAKISEEQMSILQQDADSDMETYEIYIDFQNKMSYTINKNNGRLIEFDVSYMSEYEIDTKERRYRCDSAYSIDRLCDVSFVMRYKHPEDETGSVFVEYLFEKGKTN